MSTSPPSPGGGRLVAGRDGPAGLTRREIEVLALLARGFANREMGAPR